MNITLARLFLSLVFASCFTGILHAQTCAAPYINPAANHNESCALTGTDSYAMTVTASSDSTLTIVGLYRELTPITADIDCNAGTFAIAPQHLFTNFYVRGTGSLVGTTVTINYSVYQELDSSLVESCVGAYHGTAVGTVAPLYEHLFVYPNPASQSVTVKLDPSHVSGAWTYSLMDLQGRRILVGKLDAQLQADMDLRGIAKGTYVVQLHDEAGATMHRRLVVR